MTAPVLRGILSLVLLVGLVAGREAEGSSCSEKISAKNEDIAALQKKLTGAEERVSELENEMKIFQGQMQQMSTYSETTRGELDRANKKLAVMEQEKTAALGSCAAAAKDETKQCQRDLSAASGAKKQLEKELRDTAARAELLETDIKKQKAEVEMMRKGKKDAEDKSAEAVKKVHSDTSAIKELEAKVKTLEARLEQQSGISTWLWGFVREVPFLNSTYNSASLYAKTMSENPAIRDAMLVGSEYYNAAASKASEMYAQAQPVIKQASGSSVEAARNAMQKGGEIYSTLKPQIMVILSQAETVVNDAMNSKMVVDAREQFGMVLGELKLLMKTQMKAIPSLSPYSSDEIVDMIVYGILGLPALMLLSCFGLCCCTRKQGKEAEGTNPIASGLAQRSGNAKKQKGKKGSKTR